MGSTLGSCSRPGDEHSTFSESDLESAPGSAQEGAVTMSGSVLELLHWVEGGRWRVEGAAWRPTRNPLAHGSGSPSAAGVPLTFYWNPP